VSVCDTDYSGAHDHLSNEVAGSWNVLSQSPVVSTLVVSVVEATGTVVLTEDQYVYSDTMNAVAVLPSGYMLTEDSVIEVSYTPMPI